MLWDIWIKVKVTRLVVIKGVVNCYLELKMMIHDGLAAGFAHVHHVIRPKDKLFQLETR